MHMKYSETINSLIRKGLDEVNHSINGHLSLPTRHKILQTINEPCIIGRISILCALKVYPIWDDFFKNDTEIIGLIKQSEKFLLGQINEKELLSNAEHLEVFVQDYNNENNFMAMFAGMAAVQAAYDTIAGRCINENTPDEEALQNPDEWDTAFIASLAYNGGAADLDAINHERNKEFWNWYLTDCIRTAYSNDSLPYPTNKLIASAKYFSENSKEYRTQLNLWKDNAECRSCMNDIKEILVQIMNIAQWDKSDFYFYCVGTTSYTKVLYYKGDELIKFDLAANVAIFLSEKVKTFKDLMYSLCSQEGAFYLCKITIDRDSTMDIRFDYDTRDKVLQKFFDSDFNEDFNKYPRAKKFIPDWLSDILKRKNNLISNKA